MGYPKAIARKISKDVADKKYSECEGLARFYDELAAEAAGKKGFDAKAFMIVASEAISPAIGVIGAVAPLFPGISMLPEGEATYLGNWIKSSTDNGFNERYNLNYAHKAPSRLSARLARP